jgi:hypothetical protein
MIFDELNCPRDTGATDFKDSFRLAGMMTLFNYPHPVDMKQYMSIVDGYYIRHPKVGLNEDDMSLDQAEVGMAGLWKQTGPKYISENRVIGKDWKRPDFMGHVRRMQGLKASWFQSLCLLLALLWHCWRTPLAEPNRMLAKLRVAGRDWMYLYMSLNKSWRLGLRRYWYEGWIEFDENNNPKTEGAWRGEKDLCEHIINELEKWMLNYSPPRLFRVIGLKA